MEDYPLLKKILSLLFFVFLYSCSSSGVVSPIAVSRIYPGWNLDSPVLYRLGSVPFAAVSCKNTHRLALFRFFRNGQKLVCSGGTYFLGSSGSLRRPNGIAVLSRNSRRIPDLIVVERDNRRLHIICGKPPGSGMPLHHPVLRKPYGIAVYKAGRETFSYVTDVIPDGRGRFVHKFRLKENPRRIELCCSFGTKKEGLSIPESVAVDPVNKRVVLCDETPGRGKLLVYDLDGKFLFCRGEGRFLMDPEGIAFAPRELGGYLLAVDQLPVTVINIFERKTLRFLGRTVLGGTSRTDGIAVGRVYGRSVLAAVHNDRALHLYSIRDILKNMRRP